MPVLEFEEGWGIEQYGAGEHGFTGPGQYYGIRHKHGEKWEMAVGDPKICECGAEAPDNMVAWLAVCRWRR